MKTNHILIALVFFAALLINGCAPRVRVGALRTESQSVELGDAKSVRVQVYLGAGDLKLTGDTKKLLEADFSYNVAELKPVVKFTDGTLVVHHPDVRGYRTPQDLKDFRNEWDLRLNNDVPMNLSLEMGAGTSDLQLAGLSLTGLDITLGAGKSTVDLTGNWARDLDVTIVSGAANLNVRLPRDIGARVKVEAGPHTIEVTGMTRDGDFYNNAAYGVSEVTLRVDLEAGIGQIKLEVENQAVTRD